LSSTKQVVREQRKAMILDSGEDGRIRRRVERLALVREGEMERGRRALGLSGLSGYDTSLLSGFLEAFRHASHTDTDTQLTDPQTPPSKTRFGARSLRE
jgi:hypothetical protein